MLICKHSYTIGRPEYDRNQSETFCHGIIWRININASKVVLTVWSVFLFHKMIFLP